MKAAARVISGLSPLRQALILSFASLLWSTALITNFSFILAGPEKLGLVFNDMAVRLLHLDMTIDPRLISFEGFVRDGHTYAYFGIFPALLRIPLVLAGASRFPLSRISCLLALWIVSFTTIRLTQIVLADSMRTPAVRKIAAAALLGATFSGPPIYVLASAAIYHEAIFWASAWSVVFNFIVIRRVFAGQSLRPKDFILLALAAGCGLLTRVTCGVMLYLGLALLLIWPALLRLKTSTSRDAFNQLWSTSRQAAPAVAIVVAFAAAQAAIDYGRWGDVLAVAPQQYYQTWHPRHAERVARFMRHGGLELARIPIAGLYYSVAVKVDDVFQAFFQEHYDGIEGPRMFGLLCAPWMILCSALGVSTTARHPLRSGLLLPLVITNLVGFLLLLSIFDLAQRYTFDGWAFLVLTSALGARLLMQRANNAPGRGGQWLARIGIAAALTGIVVSHATLLRYKINYSGTDPAVRYWLSEKIQPLLCPHARLSQDVKLTDFNPLVTPNCPPLW
jgi:hypothetical protein